MLTCVAVVCRERPAIDALAHVVQLLDGFLDYSERWSIPDAAGAGHLQLLQLLTTASASKSTDGQPVAGKMIARKAMRRAACNGHLHVMRWLQAAFIERNITRGALSKAVGAGHVHAAEWIHTNQPEEPCEATAIVQAVRSGHLPMVQWIVRRRRLDWVVVAAFFDPLEQAVAHGQLCIVQWLCRWTKTPRDVDKLMEFARQHRQEDIAHWLASTELMLTPSASDPAARDAEAPPLRRRGVVRAVANAHTSPALLRY